VSQSSAITQSIQIEVRRSIKDVDREQWRAVTRGLNLYLSLEYLEALESSVKDDIDFFYVCIKEGEKPVVVAVFQLVDFKYKGGKHSRFLLKNFCKYQSSEGFIIPLLIGGNVFANGENCACWVSEIANQHALDLLFKAVDKIQADPQVKKSLSIVLFKEFWPKNAAILDQLKKPNYKSFEVDVNMVMKIDPNWTSFDDYLASQKTKFRTKAKGVYKKSKSLDIRNLDFDEIDCYQEDIKRLFANVLERSEYGLGAIEPLTFGAFKRNLGNHFTLRALFLDQKLVGFSTAFQNNNVIEANYVGIDYELNHEYAIYQRLLYDHVEQAIARGAGELHLGRTSELMKSQIGALPVSMKLYARHKSILHNQILHLGLNFVKPREFELRPPFKTEQN
jgi:predicted N-acyltransferase